MWCRNCQQEVAGIRQAGSHQFGCARCGASFATIAPPASRAIVSSSPAASSPFATECQDSESTSSTATDLSRSSQSAPSPPASSRPTGKSSAPHATEQLRTALDLLDSAMHQLAEAEIEETLSTKASSNASSSSAATQSGATQQSSTHSMSIEEACSVPAGNLREISSAELPTEIPSGPPQLERSRKTIEALDREIRAVEEVLRSWQPRRQRREDQPSQELVRHYGKSSAPAERSRRRIGFRSQIIGVVNDLRSHERQLGIAIFLNVLFLCVIGSLVGWSSINGSSLPIMQVAAISISALVINLLGLGWFVSQARAQTEALEDAEHEHERFGSDNKPVATRAATDSASFSSQISGVDETTASPFENAMSNPSRPTPHLVRAKAQSVDF